MRTKLYLIIDNELKTRLKVNAAKNQKTMSEIIIGLIEEYLEENE